MKLERLGEPLGGLCGWSEKGFDKTPGFGLVQLDGIVATNDFLSSVPDMRNHERGKR